MGKAKCLQGTILTKHGMRIRLIYQEIADKDPWLNAAPGQHFCSGQQMDGIELAPSCCRYTQLSGSALIYTSGEGELGSFPSSPALNYC